jgi:excisionase family DNA binding protein
LTDLRADVLLDALRPLVAELVADEVERRLEDLGRCLDGERLKAWYTLDEAGERLGCTRDAVRMRVNRGRLEARRQGRRLYVLLSARRRTVRCLPSSRSLAS